MVSQNSVGGCKEKIFMEEKLQMKQTSWYKLLKYLVIWNPKIKA